MGSNREDLGLVAGCKGDVLLELETFNCRADCNENMCLSQAHPPVCLMAEVWDPQALGLLRGP